jgi:ribosomal protein L18
MQRPPQGSRPPRPPRTSHPSRRFVYASIFHKASPSDSGRFLAAASSQQGALREPLRAAGRPTSDTAASAEVGKLLADRAREVGGIDAVHFERKKGQRYTGKLKALIEAMRANGLRVE